MTRNNEERTGASNIDDPAPPPMMDMSPEQPFSFVTPTEFVDLPSEGKYYPEGHVLHNKDSVEIRYMTAKDEDILTSKSLLKKGIALDRLLRNVIIDKSINPNELVLGDKNAILVATRISGYGPFYNVKVTCPMCLSNSENDINLSELESSNGFESLKKHDVRCEDELFLLTLPKMQVEVGLKITTSADETEMIQKSEKRKKLKLPEAALTEQFKLLIKSVNGSTNPSHINELIDCMPALDSKYLREVYAEVTPNVDMTHDFQCTVCEYEGEVVVPFTAEFFWPK